MHVCTVCFDPMVGQDHMPTTTTLLCSDKCRAIYEDDEKSVEETYKRREACHGHSGECGPSADVIGARECRRLALVKPEVATAPGLDVCRRIAERDRAAREEAIKRGVDPRRGERRIEDPHKPIIPTYGTAQWRYYPSS